MEQGSFLSSSIFYHPLRIILFYYSYAKILLWPNKDKAKIYYYVATVYHLNGEAANKCRDDGEK